MPNTSLAKHFMLFVNPNAAADSIKNLAVVAAAVVTFSRDRINQEAIGGEKQFVGSSGGWGRNAFAKQARI
jgi:hypothetical protein